MTFKKLNPSTRDMELSMVDYWKDMALLDRCLEERKTGENYVFYEGPPTANGHPGIHHVMARTLKDMTCRYKTMQGYQVRRKAGWDTHGLPVEIEVEKKLGFSGKSDIETYGVEAFNEKCKESVFQYRGEWMEMSDRMAFMADMENPYVTMNNDYIESVWYILKNFYDRGLIYKGAKILPYCPRCGTGLASHEVAQGYQEDDVVTAYVLFPVKGKENEYFLAWTTTPWTLLSNVSLTLNPDVTYARVKQGERVMILAEDLVDQIIRKEYGDYEVLSTVKGKDLEGVEYDQLLPFIKVEPQGDEQAFIVSLADYVTTTEGTGVVHTAPTFGEEDYQTGLRYHLPLVNPVGEKGEFLEGPYKGTFVMDTDPMVLDYLQEHGLLYGRQKISHNYPHCWRCHTPLIYYSKPSWYINVTKFKDQMVAENKEVDWFPPYIGEGRFGNWLENLNDWALSRSRYWGTPLNIWKCPDCGHTHSVGSRKQLVEEAEEDIDESIDLHRPYVDRIHIKCPECGSLMEREPDVIDVWFDSGAMPFAQLHYPFEHKDDLDEYYPADFICEGVDQTRGWFYSLMAISTLLKGKAPYKNVLVNDLVLDSEGRKMSKSLGNTLAPLDLFDEFGADTVRFYSLYVSPPWLTTRFDVEGLKEVQSKFFRTIKNVYAMFALYANTNGMDPRDWEIPYEDRPQIDRWLLSRYNSLVKEYVADMDIFEYNRVVREINSFVVEDLSNWYIRRSRNRFWSSEESLEVKSCFRTTWEVLRGVSLLMAPITPFLAEELYQALMDDQAMDSVHLERIPEVQEEAIDKELETKMDRVRTIVNLGRACRDKVQIKVRQPLSRILVDKKFEDQLADLVPLVKEELNVKDVVFSDELDELMNIKLKPNFKLAGPDLASNIKYLAKYLGQVDARDFLQNLGETFTFPADGEDLEVPKSYVDVQLSAKEGYDMAMDGPVSVVLDTDLTDDLVQEGLAREFISQIQQARKGNGYEVSDRIHISYAGDDEVAEAFEANADMIQSNTLALSMERVDKLDQDPVELNGKEVAFSLTRDGED